MFRSIRKFVSHILDEAALWGHVAADAIGTLAGPEEEEEETLIPEPARDWSVTWIVAKDHRAVIGHRSSMNLNEIVPEGLVRGHILATGLTEDECKRFVDSVGPRPDLLRSDLSTRQSDLLRSDLSTRQSDLSTRQSDLSSWGVRKTQFSTSHFTEPPVLCRTETPTTFPARSSPEGVVRVLICEDYILWSYGFYDARAG